MLFCCLGKSGQWDLVDAASLTEIEAEIRRYGLGRERQRVFAPVYSIALAFAEKNRGNEFRYIDYLVEANRKRSGTFEQMPCEWIPDTIVRLLTNSGDSGTT